MSPTRARHALVPLALVALLAALWAVTGQHALAQTAPTITSVTPSSGPASGGTAVAITGTNFQAGAVAGTEVTFNGVAGTVTAVTSTQITVTTPPGAPGPVLIRVTNPSGESTTINGAFTYSGPAPTVDDVTPDTGPSTGGTTVVIDGTGFVSGATVRFGGTLATGVTVNSSTRITAVTPARPAGTVTVQVTNPDAQSGSLLNGFTYTPAAAPTVSTVSPTSGSTGGGTPVVITGTGFVNGATVRFGTANATSVVVTGSTQITAVTPAHAAGTVSVQVTNPDGQSGTRASAFTYVTTPTPTVTSVSPNFSPLAGGVVVTITGTNFQPGAVASFGGTNSPSTVYVSANQVQAVAPARATAGTVSVRVTNTDGKYGTLSNAFTYGNPTPTIASLAPTSGTTAGGTDVTITGTNFYPGTTVTFGGTSAVSVNVLNTTTLIARTPARPAGTVAVTVRSATGQTATRNNAYTFRAPAVVTGISPSSGVTTGGTLVTITGSGFTAGSTVTIGGTPATNVNVVNSNQITARTPAHAVGTAVVQVMSADFIVATGAPTFTYTVAPPAGTIVSGTMPTSGVGLILFSGGNNDQLTAAGVAGGCAVSRISFFATVGGQFVVYIPATNIALVNAAWNQHFANNIPANTPLLAVCR